MTSILAVDRARDLQQIKRAEALVPLLDPWILRFPAGSPPHNRLQLLRNNLWNLSQQVARRRYPETGFYVAQLDLLGGPNAAAQTAVNKATAEAVPYTRGGANSPIAWVNIPLAVQTCIINHIAGAGNIGFRRDLHATDAFSAIGMTKATSHTTEWSENDVPALYRWTIREPRGWWHTAYFFSDAGHGAGQYSYRLITAIPAYVQHQ